MTFRGRLIGAFVAVALGVLVVAGGTTLAFARANARDAAVDDLREQAGTLAALLDRAPLEAPLRRSLLRTLQLQDATLVGVAPRGIVGDVPEALAAAEVELEALLRGEEVSGQVGSTVYLAAPFGPVQTPGGTREVQRAVILTRDVGGIDLGGLGPFLLVAAGVALLAAVGAGTVLARRLTRPLEATARAARTIAGGDLSARVGDDDRTDLELVAVARAFDDMAEELERSRSLTREFLMSVSHDLRTPLTSIRGYAEALAEGTARSAPDRRRAAAVIESEARRLERLVSDLLDLARLDARSFSLDPGPTDVGSVVRTVAEGLEPLARELGIDLAVDVPATAEREVDPERLGQLVANLVENALKFAHQRVDVAVRELDGGITIEVRDDGPGIPDHDRDRVFERLYTAGRDGGRAVGTGLGLAIVHELVEAMGGAVEAESPEGRGGRFTVALP